MLCVKGLGAKPVQKLGEHSELVQPGWRVHCILSVVSDPIRIAQRENQVGELILLEFGDKLLVLFMCELARVVFEDRLGSLTTGCAEQHDRGNIIPVGFGNTSYLLGQNPHGNSVVPGAEAEINQLARATLDIFRRSAVIQYEQGVGSREKVAGHPQPVLDFVLQAGDDKDVRIAFHESLVSSILNKGGAEEHDVVKLAPERAPQLGEKILCLA